MFEGIKVIEYVIYIVVLGVGGMFVDWGVDVIKIEFFEGDLICDFFGLLGFDLFGNFVFDFDNCGKCSIVVDISKLEGVDIVWKLVVDVDVFLMNVCYFFFEWVGFDY